MNKDEIDAVAKATAEIVKAVPVYEDAVQPVAQEVGKALKTLGGVINVALAPLAAVVYGYDVIKVQLRTRLEARLASVPPENIVTPKLQVVGPLLDKYKYVHDDPDLSEMFINLFANAMDKDKIQNAHPSFVNVISELSPDEAKLIKILSTEVVLPKIDVRLKDKNVSNRGFHYIERNFTTLGVKAGVNYPELTTTYLSNLERLNIISCPIGEFQDHYSDETVYQPLENHSEILKLKEMCPSDKEIEIKKGIISVTDFGRMFMTAVLK